MESPDETAGTAGDAVEPGTVRPGGRTARVRAAVLEAAGDTLAEQGFHGLDLAEIARRADVGKTTVYRRWGTVAGLVADLLTDMAEQSLPRTDTGSLLEDLLANAALVRRTLTDPRQGALFKAVIAAATGTRARPRRCTASTRSGSRNGRPACGRPSSGGVAGGDGRRRGDPGRVRPAVLPVPHHRGAAGRGRGRAGGPGGGGGGPRGGVRTGGGGAGLSRGRAVGEGAGGRRAGRVPGLRCGR